MARQPAAPAPPTGADLRSALHEWFGFADFRPGQQEAIEHLLRGEDLLVVRPTGSGKSLCYQLPGLIQAPLTIVISPLIALMKDQVDALCARHAGAATCINSSLAIDEQRARLHDVVAGRYQLLYVAPERFRYAGFVKQLRQTQVTRFVVDEAHCVSEWGHDFRPDYLHLRQVLPELGDPPLLALTATATVDVQRDIARQLGRPNLPAMVSGFNRPNLSFEVRYAADEGLKYAQLERLLGELDGSGIIYTGTRRTTEEVADFVRRHTQRPVRAYHAGFETDHRNQAQEAFMAEPDAIVVATVAFGMGIDKPDVRFVIHFQLPGTVEAYYQQAGRAGRDGLPARCVLIYDPSDKGLQEWFIDQEAVASEQLAVALEAVERGLADFTRLGDLMGCNDIQARVAVSALERLGLIADRGASEQEHRFEVLRSPLPEDLARDHDQRVGERRALRLAQLQAMVRFAETAHPRRRFLLQYFGDSTQPGDEELARDDPPPQPPDPGVVTPEESELGRLILACVATVPHGLGRQKVIQVLRGSKDQGIHDRLRKLPVYGQLKSWRADQLQAALDELLLAGLLKVLGGDRPVLGLTPAGRNLADDPRALIALPPVRQMAPVLAANHPGTDHRLTDPTQVLDPTAAVLFERLREWRLGKARERGLAPFMVLSDATLQAVCRALPHELSELLQVPGFGPRKTERYGAEVLLVVDRWRCEVAGPARAAKPASARPTAAPPPPLPRPEPAPVDRPVAPELQATLDRLQAGDPVAAIAADRGVSLTVVTNEVGALIAQRRLRPADVVGEELVSRITGVLHERPGLTLQEAREALGPGVPYHVIRWVREGATAPPPAVPAVAAAPGPALPPGPWTRVLPAAGEWADLSAVVEALGGDQREGWRLGASVGHDDEVDRLLLRLGRETGLPVLAGLWDADGCQLHPVPGGTVRVIVGRPGDLGRAATALEPAAAESLIAVVLPPRG